MARVYAPAGKIGQPKRGLPHVKDGRKAGIALKTADGEARLRAMRSAAPTELDPDE